MRWATATAASRRPAIQHPRASRFQWQWATSMPTATLTSCALRLTSMVSSKVTSRCCSAMARAASLHLAVTTTMPVPLGGRRPQRRRQIRRGRGAGHNETRERSARQRRRHAELLRPAICHRQQYPGGGGRRLHRRRHPRPGRRRHIRWWPSCRATATVRSRSDPPTHQQRRSQTAAAVADFNGDGKLDVVTADGSEGAVSVLLGLGNGMFTLAGDHAAGSSPRAVAVGDFNGDGRPDVGGGQRRLEHGLGATQRRRLAPTRTPRSCRSAT